MATPTPPTRYVAKRKESDSGRRMTHERIAADLEAFRKAGGRIEVLGTTRVLTKIDQPATAQATASAPAAAPARARKKA